MGPGLLFQLLYYRFRLKVIVKLCSGKKNKVFAGLLVKKQFMRRIQFFYSLI